MSDPRGSVSPHVGEQTSPDDRELTRAVAEAVFVPVIASGGVGRLEHLYEGLTTGRADAALAASIFHFGEHSILEAKAYLRDRGVPVRLEEPPA